MLLRGLSHPSTRVQTLAVAQLARSAQDEDLAAQLVQRDLVSPAFELLAGDLAVATEVTNMAIALGIVFKDFESFEFDFRGDTCWPGCPQRTLCTQATA